jgi:hypothetical protein
MGCGAGEMTWDSLPGCLPKADSPCRRGRAFVSIGRKKRHSTLVLFREEVRNRPIRRFQTQFPREIGCLQEPSLLASDEQKFTRLRYNTRLDLPDGAGRVRPLSTARLAELRLIPQLQTLGCAYAEEHVRPEHRPPA